MKATEPAGPDAPLFAALEAEQLKLHQLKLKLAEGHPEKRKPKPLTASQLAKRYGLEPTTIANLKVSQAKLKAMGRDLTLEQVYALESDQPA